MSISPNAQHNDRDIAAAIEYATTMGELAGRRTALAIHAANAYNDAFHLEINRAGLCDCTITDEPGTDDVQVVDLPHPFAQAFANLHASLFPTAPRAEQPAEPATGVCSGCGLPRGADHTKCWGLSFGTTGMVRPEGIGPLAVVPAETAQDAPFVACKAPDPWGAASFCRQPIGHPEGQCEFVPANQLPASADDEGDEPIRCTFCGHIVLCYDGDWTHEDRSHNNHEATPPDDEPGQEGAEADDNPAFQDTDPAQVRIDERAQGGIMSSPAVPVTITYHDAPAPAGLAQAVLAEVADNIRNGRPPLGRA